MADSGRYDEQAGSSVDVDEFFDLGASTVHACKMASPFRIPLVRRRQASCVR